MEMETKMESGKTGQESNLDSFSIIGNVQDISQLSDSDLLRELEFLRSHRRTSANEKRLATKKKTEASKKENPLLLMIQERLKGKSPKKVAEVMERLRAIGLSGDGDGDGETET